MAVRSLITIDEGTSMAEAALKFQNHRFLSLPVVRADGSVAGVVDLAELTGAAVDHFDKRVVEEMFQPSAFVWRP